MKAKVNEIVEKKKKVILKRILGRAKPGHGGKKTNRSCLIGADVDQTLMKHSYVK